EPRRQMQPPPPGETAEEDQQQRETSDIERPAVIVEHTEQQVRLAPPRVVTKPAAGYGRPRDEDDRCRDHELGGKKGYTTAEGSPLPGMPFGQRRPRLDAGDHQRIQPEGGDMAEETEERDQHGGAEPQPDSGVLQGKPQRHPTEHDPQAEQIIEEPPQEL